MKNKLLIIYGGILGFVLSTSLAFFIGGHYPCEVYGLCKADVLAENERLLKEAAQLKEDIAKIRSENLTTIGELQKVIATQKSISDSIKDSLASMVSTIKKGISNENKLRNISKAIKKIAKVLINSPDDSVPGDGRT